MLNLSNRMLYSKSKEKKRIEGEEVKGEEEDGEGNLLWWFLVANMFI